MFIDLHRIPLDGQAIALNLPAGSFSTSDELRLVDRVHLNGRLDLAKEHAFRLRAKLEAVVELACVRCLDLFTLQVKEDLDLLYLPQSANVAKAPVPGENEEEGRLKEEDLSVGFYRDEKIDLGLMVWEQVYLSLPMKPLCRGECRGLCPVCGTNLNSSSCDCVRDTVDPRLASLKALLKS
jgi:uncharacterized protein